jgi:dTDP-4-dehydrorhamnose reductase
MSAHIPGTTPILVLGANGQVGRALAQHLGPSRCIALSREQAPLDHPEKLPAVLARYRPCAVINAGAYTQVDLAEKEESLARTVNGQAPGVLAQWCAAAKIPFVHYSTDYVFEGTGTRPWAEDDAIHPLNAYGRTKAEGEARVREAGGKYLIFRTSWVFDAFGKNFVNTMLRLGAERDALKVVADQHGAPTYAPHLAGATIEALSRAMTMPLTPVTQFPSGVYHLSNAGETTWHGFAEAIFSEALARKLVKLKISAGKVEAISSSEFPTPARRPVNSRLNLSKIDTVLGVRMPEWRVGLNACLDLKLKTLRKEKGRV